MYTFTNIEKEERKKKKKKTREFTYKFSRNEMKGVIAFIVNSDVYVHCSVR